MVADSTGALHRPRALNLVMRGCAVPCKLCRVSACASPCRRRALCWTCSRPSASQTRACCLPSSCPSSPRARASAGDSASASGPRRPHCASLHRWWGGCTAALVPTRCSRSEADRWSWWAAATGRYDNNTDTLVLSQEPIDEEHTTVLEKVALSHGIQRSVKMARIENNMDELVASLKSVPAHMMRGWVRGDAPSARRQIMQKLGEILHLRDAINLQVPPRAAYHTDLTACKRRDMSRTLAPLRRHNRPHGRGTFRGRMDRGRSRFRTRIGTCMRSQTSTIASPKSQAPSLRAWRSDLCTRSPAPAPWHCRAGARPAAEPRVPAQVRDIAAHQHAEPQARLRARDGRGTPHAAAGCFAVPTFVGITLFSSTVSVNARFLCRRTSRRCLRAPSSLSSASRSRSRSTRCPGAFARGCTTMQTRTRSREGCAAVRRRLQVAVAKVRKG